jgi:acyl-CoA synthetase (AMP-forming)/AMP-acid ligase II
LNSKIVALFACFWLAACVWQAPVRSLTSGVSSDEIVYMSSDRRLVAVFTDNSARFGEFFLELSKVTATPSPATYFESSGNIQCVSVGPPQDSIQFAIKRPIKQGEEYHCLKSRFRVSKCFDECRAAVLQVSSPLSGGASGFLESQIYVDNCFGILAFSVAGDLANGIPLNAQWLRGPVGILAHRNYPKCRPF